jgi:hypothetical protein
LSDLDVTISRDPRPVEPYFERAALRQAKGETVKTLADLDEGLSRDPKNIAGLRAPPRLWRARATSRQSTISTAP